MNARSAASAPTLDSHRILIVEDEVLLAIELSAALEDEGCTVIGPAKNMARAMALLAEEPPPEACILDLNLAGVSSVPIAAELRARNIPFVVTSGYSETVTDDPTLQDTAWLAKPIVHEDLIRALRSLFAPRKA